MTTDHYGLNLLDDDALAELEVNEFLENVILLSSTRTKEDTSGAMMGEKWDFTISYNGKKKECLVEEELFESKDEEGARNKEKSSTNKSRVNSSYFDKQS